jgi:CheY-like chemotaxis protein
MLVRAFAILIVDDDRMCRRILEHRLRRLGFTHIDAAADGVACMAKKLPCLLLDGKTIKSRLEALGIPEIMRVIEHEAEAFPHPSGQLAAVMG